MNDHAQNQHRNYNTFRVFDHYYSDRESKDYDELKMPVHPKNRHFGFKLVIFIILLSLIGLSLHPILSYTFKTPYPLVIIAENSMSPTLFKNDLILVKGLISKYEINKNDIVIYNNYSNGVLENSLTVKRVTLADHDQLTVKGDNSQTEQKISYAQVIGRAVGEASPIKVKWVGVISKILN